MLFVDTRIGESGFKSNRRGLADPFQRGCAAELSALRGADPTVDARTRSRIRARWFTLELKSRGRVLTREGNKRLGLSLKGLTRMSPILPISFLVTLLCAFGAVEGMLFQQLMFVGAALSATILVCSFEAWSAREIPVRSDDETRLRSHWDH
jgi:hypothetical protein